MAGWGLAYEYSTNSFILKKSMDVASLEVNSREYCDKIFSAENLKKYKIKPRILQRQLTKGFTDVIACIGNNFDEAQSKFIHTNLKQD